MFAIPECILSRLEEPLTPEQEEAVQQGKMGFEAKDVRAGRNLTLYPTTWGAPSYWIWAYRELSSGIEHYSPNSTSAGRIPWDMFLVGVLKPIPLGAVDHWPPTSGKEKRENQKTNLYLIQAENGGPIKIGVSSNIESRLSQLQTGSPFILRVIGEYNGVSPSLEKQVHAELAEYRLHGEWFNPVVIDLVPEVVKMLTDDNPFAF